MEIVCSFVSGIIITLVWCYCANRNVNKQLRSLGGSNPPKDKDEK